MWIVSVYQARVLVILVVAIIRTEQQLVWYILDTFWRKWVDEL